MRLGLIRLSEQVMNSVEGDCDSARSQITPYALYRRSRRKAERLKRADKAVFDFWLHSDAHLLSRDGFMATQL